MASTVEGSPVRSVGSTSIDLGLCSFGLWTLFVWGGRLRNVARDLGDDVSVGWFSIVASVVFTALGLVVVALFIVRPLRRRRAGSADPVDLDGAGLTGADRVGRAVVWALIILTTVVWVIRGIDIALGDHSAGFIAVHVVLAVVSIGLALVVALRRSGWDIRPGDRAAVRS